jgi:hypothetical protein
MVKKRLVIDLNQVDHAALVQAARAIDSTVANYVRRALNLPLQRQGVKAAETTKKKAPTQRKRRGK